MIYADYNGSAPLCQEVRDHLVERIPNGPYANPNAIHSLGKKMLFGLDKCRRVCAKALGAKPNHIIFNSGSSEGITHAFYSVLSQNDVSKKSVIITSGIEHAVVVQACEYYQTKHNYEVIKVRTLQNGMVDLENFENILTKEKHRVALVSIMAANNETGVIQPWKEIAQSCNKNSIPFICDTTQYIGKTDFNFEDSGIDFAVMSGHKIGALTGTGILLVKEPHKALTHIFGGGQEAGLRGGTQNYIGAETLAVAFDAFEKKKSGLKDLTNARKRFEQNVKNAFPDAVVIGDSVPRLATTTLIALPGIHGQAVQIELESKNIFVTTSSACSDNEPETSKVLRSMKIDDEIGRGVVRISLCCSSAIETYKEIEEVLIETYKKLSKISNF